MSDDQKKTLPSTALTATARAKIAYGKFISAEDVESLCAEIEAQTAFIADLKECVPPREATLAELPDAYKAVLLSCVRDLLYGGAS